jgi:hypothetical protein
MVPAVLLAAALPTIGPAPMPSGTPVPLAVPTRIDKAVIIKSSSTNTEGYQLNVFENGATMLVQGNIPIRRHVPMHLVTRFFNDLHAAGNLAALPSMYCMKSSSFGTTLRIAYRGKTSPDVSCPTSSRIERALDLDAEALATAAGVSIAPGPRTRPGIP